MTFFRVQLVQLNYFNGGANLEFDESATQFHVTKAP